MLFNQIIYHTENVNANLRVHKNSLIGIQGSGANSVLWKLKSGFLEEEKKLPYISGALKAGREIISLRSPVRTL